MRMLCADELASRPEVTASAGRPAAARAWLIRASTCAAAVPFWAAGVPAEAELAAGAVAWAVAWVVAGAAAAGCVADELADPDGRAVDVCALGVAWRAGAVTTVGDAATARPDWLVAGEFADAGPGAGLEEDAPQPLSNSTASTSAPGSRNLTLRVPRLMPSLLTGDDTRAPAPDLFQHGQTSPVAGRG
jgi:hypothetical protein